MKYNTGFPVAAAAILVAIPYSIALTAQWLYGWPDKPGYKKYAEALKPRRIYGLTRAVLGMMKYLKYSRLYFQWKLWYKENNSNQCVKSIPFGHRGNKLDLYHSPKINKSDTELLPVVVFVYGGAWGSGERSMYCLLALQLAKELNATVICPDYTTYPKGNVLNMVQDISDSLMWVRENGHLFQLNKDNIVLIGHSAGAHLCALTTLFLLEGTESLFIEPSRQNEIINSIKGLIGLSGVYDIMDHYEHEKTRGVEYISAMHKAMDGVENFEFYSPTARIRKLNKERLERANFGLKKPLKMNMVKRIMGRPRQDECSPQDNALGLMHLRRLFSELCHPPRHMTQKEQEEKLYMMLPVFNRVRNRVTCCIVIMRTLK
ncbi:WD repeat and FYVE domain-containing protein 3 [Bagarius yarrelli]|uniref:WD repeat and FYVE domain-containing protein 3 n=1 Tax=Bagarius yarrelli TaxID=175774 RepID=A0A556U820_BAGYA|nr:WD repeat and FYVE domain-containing protein 3 [Bagarius yarrelli]